MNDSEQHFFYELFTRHNNVSYSPLIKEDNGRWTYQIPDDQLHSFHLWNLWKHADHYGVCPWQKAAEKVPQCFHSLPCHSRCADLHPRAHKPGLWPWWPLSSSNQYSSRWDLLPFFLEPCFYLSARVFLRLHHIAVSNRAVGCCCKAF